MKKIRIGLVGLVVLALTGLSAGGAVAATGRGTAAASIILLDVSLGNVQNLKVLVDEGQGTLDPTRLGIAGPRSFGQLKAVDARGAVNLALPNPPLRAEAPGSGSASLASIPVSFPPSQIAGVGGLPIGAGVLASGTINPVKVEAFNDASGARSGVGTEVPSLSVLQGLISVNNVKIGTVASNATPSSSTADTGVVSIGDISVLDLSSFLGGLGLGLEDLNPSALLGMVDKLGLPVSTAGIPGIGSISGITSITSLLNSVTGLTSVLNGVTGANSCADLANVGGILSGLGLDGLLGTGGLLSSVTSLLGGVLPVGDVLSTCSGGFAAAKSNAIAPLQSALNNIAPTADGLLDSVFGILDSAPLLSLSGLELSALAKAADTLAASSATTSVKFGTLKVGGNAIGALDLNATVEQVTSLVNTVESALNGVTSILGLGNLIDIGILERTASTKAEGGYNVAEAGVNVLRVSINPPAVLSSVLAPVTTGSIGSLLGGNSLFSGLPLNLGLADNTLASAFSLTSLLAQPTTITVGAIGAQSDFTTAAPSAVGAPGGPVSPPVSGQLPRTGSNSGAWMAALAALALAGAFAITRNLRKAPVQG